METLLTQALETAPPLPVPTDKNLKSVSTQAALPPPLIPENIFGLQPYVAKAIEDEMQGLATTPEGGRRKKLLSVVAKLGGFVSTGNLTEEILRARAEKAFQKCHPKDFDTPEVKKEFTEAFREALAYGMKCPREIPDPLPPGFSLVQSGPDAGLWYAPPPKDERDQPTKIRLGTPIEVLELVRDGSSEGWGRRVKWHDPDGVPHCRVIPDELLAGNESAKWLSTFASGGWVLQGAAGIALNF